MILLHALERKAGGDYLYTAADGEHILYLYKNAFRMEAAFRWLDNFRLYCINRARFAFNVFRSSLFQRSWLIRLGETVCCGVTIACRSMAFWFCRPGLCGLFYFSRMQDVKPSFLWRIVMCHQSPVGSKGDLECEWLMAHDEIIELSEPVQDSSVSERCRDLHFRMCNFPWD